METSNPVLPQPRPVWFQEAADAWRRQDYQKTIELLTRASQQQPADAKILLNIGEAYGRRYDYAEAERWLENAVTISPNKAEALAEAGRCCQRFGHADM